MKLGAYETNNVYCCDALTLLKGLPDESVHCLVTSPPYFGLRDYGVDGQLGLEETPEAYVDALVAVFREARRVLRNDGTFWLNLGDSYVGATSQHFGGESQGHNSVIAKGTYAAVPTSGREARNKALYAAGLPMKSLLLIPARAALGLQADGWLLRSDIIWAKPNPMPESVTDRPTKSHEHLFMLAKSGRYHYDSDAIKEPAQDWGTRDRSNGKYTSGDVPISGGKHGGLTGKQKQNAVGKRTYTGFNDRYFAEERELTRNRRDVWTIPTQPFPGAHFAVMPEALVQPCILAGCPEGGVVLDMFGGSGTVGMVAKILNRNYILCDINPEYVAIAEQRIAQVTPMLPGFVDTRASYDTTGTAQPDSQLRLLPDESEILEKV